MSWNHRVLKHVDVEGNETFMIHEVYYDHDGKPCMYTMNGVTPYGETLIELREEIKHFMSAFEKPVLTPTDFPPENDAA